MINEKWSRWITASVFDYINTSLTTTLPGNTEIFLEGQIDPNSKRQHWFELRLDGPLYQPMSNGEWEATVEINILVSAHLNEESIYVIRDLSGAAAKALSGCIDLKQMGDGEAIFGCLKLGQVFQNHFGQIGKDVTLQQATVETRGTVDDLK